MQVELDSVSSNIYKISSAALRMHMEFAHENSYWAIPTTKFQLTVFKPRLLPPNDPHFGRWFKLADRPSAAKMDNLKLDIVGAAQPL